MALESRLEQVCEHHDLAVVEVYASKPDRIVALVRRSGGELRLLKVTGAAYRNQREQALCEAWAGVGLSPPGVLLEPDSLLRGWVDGPLLHELGCRGASHVEAVGRLLLQAHRAQTRFPFPAMSEFLTARLAGQRNDSRMTPAQRRYVERVATRAIAVCDDGALAHGDLAPVNMFLDGQAIVLIDGRGHRGGSALDLADYAVRVHDGNPLELIGGLVAGYGSAPAGLTDQLAWLLATDCIWHPRSDCQQALGEEALSRGAGRVCELAGLWQ